MVESYKVLTKKSVMRIKSTKTFLLKALTLGWGIKAFSTDINVSVTMFALHVGCQRHLGAKHRITLVTREISVAHVKASVKH